MTIISKVYYSNAVNVRGIGGPSQKLVKLLEKSNLADLITPGDRIAVKMHLGEPGCVRYLRPVFPVLIVDFLKKCGGRPFVTDAPVMYKSDRDNFHGYLNAARRNGFTEEVLGCPLIISGGVDEQGYTFDVPDPLILDNITVSRDIWEADFLFSLAHFTMHLEFPFAGSLKNIAMGSVDRATKLKMHSVRKFSPPLLNSQAANTDGAKVILGKFESKAFACNIALDVTPECDCFHKSDLPIVPDVGIFLSDDIVACDKASFDKVIDAPGYPGCLMEGHEGMLPGGNKVNACHNKQKNADFHDECISKANIGNLNYELIEI